MTPLVKEKKLTEKQEAFLEALVTDAKGNIREAMKMAGYASTTKTAEVVSALREEIIEKASMVLAMNAPKAAFGIVGVLDDPSAMGARNSVAAAREILDRTGLVKKEQVEVKGPENGLFILPPKKTDDGLGTED
ncbi:putative terminase small subunit [Roseobacter phage CRP-212]|jgi:hypothetical protein|nr:putative terminase small subunit [Roseobacter phage CRP-212]